MILSRDVQSEAAPTPIEIDWVTVSNVYFPIEDDKLESYRLASTPYIEASVNLPHSQRGIHASRTYEAVKTAVTNLEYQNIYQITPLIAKTLLEKHIYSTKAKAALRTSLFDVAKTPVSNMESVEHFDAVFKSYAYRTNGSVLVRNFVGVRAVGITACPCAKEVIREVYAHAGGNGNGSLIPTHMQRAYADIVVETDGTIRLADLLEILRESFSSRTVELLKRLDEAALVVSAVEKPRFVEDVVRTAANTAVRRFPNVPDSYRLAIKVKSLESIHRHDMQSKLRTSFGKIRRQIENNGMA
ncbi:MAG: GTP cyclohydrolase I FolE2 [Candidatus Caldarchaeum sp.]|nr:GTP cyclohydrolase I FolE2 [Candidatus Caldarchaeum sp.]MCX8200608.1 GTP cyclohydrolase I FolE2 [Candidatus Caldarchaeum sp.]MDW8435740.1 GTP cyclohydrolase I FolE2 [Candidatus Caldarchaeum sp.]